jgi:hypothetical protein
LHLEPGGHAGEGGKDAGELRARCDLDRKRERLAFYWRVGGLSMQEFAGYVYAKTGTVLGGVKANRSTAFKTRDEARAWMFQVLEANKQAKCDVEGQVWMLWNGKVVEKR